MTVYVDTMEAPFRNMIMCHMFADTTDELNAMADLIGVARRHIQHPGTYREHYDIAKSKRRLALKYGAVEMIYGHESGMWTNRKMQRMWVVQRMERYTANMKEATKAFTEKYGFNFLEMDK